MLEQLQKLTVYCDVDVGTDIDLTLNRAKVRLKMREWKKCE